jgi:hypothetical protein
MGREAFKRELESRLGVNRLGEAGIDALLKAATEPDPIPISRLETLDMFHYLGGTERCVSVVIGSMPNDRVAVCQTNGHGGLGWVPTDCLVIPTGKKWTP